MESRKTHGLRVFLLTLLELEMQGKKEKCEEIERMISKGIATALYQKYTSYFEANGFHPDNIDGIDNYYKQWDGCADGKELSHYMCSEDNGIVLLIALALNEIY